jgi:ABC-type Mn2+/Zn2+ transport system ATPase subunit
MITKITIRNFKKFEEVSFELSNPVVLIGPNNSGKTSILQAITLWEAGLKKWAGEKTGKGSKGGKQLGRPINRKDLISLPVPSAKLLWHNLSTHIVSKENGKQNTDYIFLDISVEGNDNGKGWIGAFEFYYANEESFYCRPLRKKEQNDERFGISNEAFKTKVAYLQPMSGLTSIEDRLTPGSIDRKIGEGKTADVIRNICYQLLHPERETDNVSDAMIKSRWSDIYTIVKDRFGAEIQEPSYFPDTGLLEMKYKENSILYDLSSAGRGMQQTLLLLCFLYANPGKVILMDEPDAHLEVLRQKEIYNLISDITRKLGSQLIIASHSEVVLDEAASSDDRVIAVIEQKAIHLNDKRIMREARKALTDIGWHKYYLAKLKKHCIYLEGTTDERNIKAFANLLGHPVKILLEEAFIDPVEGNLPGEAYQRFQSLKLIDPLLKGIALFDRLEKNIDPTAPLKVIQWEKREIENYFCSPEIFILWAERQGNELFSQNYPTVMNEVIKDVFPPLYLNNREDQWWDNERMSEWAERVFKEFFGRLKLPVTMSKGNFHELITLMKPEDVPAEISDKLNSLHDVLKE